MTLAQCLTVQVLLVASWPAALTAGPSAPAYDIRAQVKELRGQAVSVRSIDPSDEDFSDLLPLKDVLKGITVVGLGEATHADGATYRAKVRLVKFLHQNMGFDVLIWEAGFLDAYFLNQALRDPSVSLTSAKANLMNDTWATSENVNGLFAYARASWQTPHPLQMAGMDGGHPDLGFEHFEHLLDNIVSNLSAHTVNHIQRERIDSLARRVFGEPSYAAALSAHQRQQQRQALEDLLSKVRRRRRMQPLVEEQRDDADFAEEALHATLLDESVKYLYGKYLSTRQGVWARRSNAIREANMGELFLWLRDHRFAGKKLMIWAATAHLAKRAISSRLTGRGESKALGDYLWGRLGKQFYIVALTANSGKIGVVTTCSQQQVGDLAPTPTGSFEDLGRRLGLPFFFVDLRHIPLTSWLNGRYNARPIGYSPEKKQWDHAVDSFFYLEKAEPDVVGCGLESSRD